jgi:hypothetical protein
LQGSAVATAAGAGMVAYAVRYQSTRACHRLSLAPELSGDTMGLSVSGRF